MNKGKNNMALTQPLTALALCLLVGSAAAACPALTSFTGSGSFGVSSTDYANSMTCTFTLTASPSNVVRLSFSAFRTEQNFDVVTVYDGSSTAARVLGTFSGSVLPGVLQSTGGVMTVVFRTDV